MYSFTRDWFSHNIDIWEQLFDQVNPKTVLEIGSYEGRSAVWMMDRGCHVTCIDTWSNEEVEKRFDENTQGKTVKIKGKSSLLLRSLVNDSYDFIYIDGSHMACDVIQDLILAYPLLKIEGIMVCDDYMYQLGGNPIHSPKPAIDAFINCYAEKIELLNAPIQQIFIRKKYEV